MSYIKVHGLKLVNGAVIENAVFESITTSLTQEQINASALGRTYFDVTTNALMTVVSDGKGGKIVQKAGSIDYVPNTNSPILSAAMSFNSADELLEVAIIDLQADTTTLRADVDALMSDSGSLSYTYISETAEKVHTLQHNLDADFSDVAVWVKDPDTGIYSADLVSIIETDKNTVKIELTEAYNIKAIIRRADPTIKARKLNI